MFKNSSYRRGYTQGFNDAALEAAQRKKEFRRIELQVLVDHPVIVIGNEWDDPVIGFGQEIQYVSKAENPTLVVFDYLRMEKVLTFGIILPFTDQMYSVVKRLDPYERWAIASGAVECCKDFDKPRSGTASTAEQLDEKLQASGFFAALERFKSVQDLLHSLR